MAENDVADEVKGDVGPRIECYASGTTDIPSSSSSLATLDPSLLNLLQDVKDTQQYLSGEIEKIWKDELHNEKMRQSELRKLHENQERFYQEVKQLREEVLRIGSESKDHADRVTSAQHQLLSEVQGLRESFCRQYTDENDLDEGEFASPVACSNADASDTSSQPARTSASVRDSLSHIPFAASLTNGERSLGQILQDSQTEAQRRMEELGQLTSTAFENIGSATRASLGWQTIRHNHRRLHHERRVHSRRSAAKRNTVELHRTKVHLYKVADAARQMSQHEHTVNHDNASPNRETIAGTPGVDVARDAVRVASASHGEPAGEQDEGSERPEHLVDALDRPSEEPEALHSHSPGKSRNSRGSVTFSDHITVDTGGQQHTVTVDTSPKPERQEFI